MNSKAIAVIMAVAMAVVGFSIVIADDADADPTERPLDKVTVEVGSTDASTVVGINEGNYTGYKYTLTWNITVNNTTKALYVVDTIGSSGADNTLYVTSTGVQTEETGSAFSISMDDVENQTGVYTISVTGVNAAKDITYTLEPTITVQTGGGEKTFPNFAKFTGTVNVIKVEEGQITVEINNTTAAAQVGKYYMGNIAFEEGSTMVVSDYDWYAVRLPEGLTMASNGQVSGIPTDGADAKNPYTITVFATDKTGNMYYGTITGFTVAAKQTAVEANGFGYYINEASPAEDVTSAGSNKATYLFSADETKAGIKLYLTDDDGSLIQSTNLSNYTVKVIKDDGINNSLQPTGDYYKLPGSGSGAYTVTITDNAEKKTAAFTVYIIGEAANITASIVIEGA